MNVPQIYLVEPYNAYAPKNRKKHIAEILDEQALLARIMAEAKNASLPQNAPNVSVATAVGQSAVAAGGGGQPFPSWYNPTMTISFLVSTTTASVPATFLFSNSSNPSTQPVGTVNWLWTFGDGTTSTDLSPTKTYTTTGSNFSVTLKGTAVSTGVTGSTTQSLNLTAPTVTAGFTVTSSLSSSAGGAISGSAPLTVAFLNTTTTNNAGNSIAYVWNFGSGSITSSLSTPANFTYTATGSYTVRLDATGSFNIMSAATRVAVVVVT